MTHIDRNIVGEIFAFASAAPEKIAIAQGDRRITYSDLKNQIGRVAAGLRERDVPVGGVVLVFAPQSIDGIIVFFGAMCVGAIPAFMPLPSEKQAPEAYWKSHVELLDRIRPAMVVTTSESRQHLVTAGLDKFTAAPIDTMAALLATATQVTEPINSTISLLQHSSGTTALKKGVMLGHGAVRRQIENYARATAASDQDVVVSWLPVYHDMGLIACTVMPLMLGQTVILMDPFEWARSPHLLLEAITQHRGTLCWLPNFAFDHIAKSLPRLVEQGASFDLSSMRMFINCSEPCKADTFDRFATATAAFGVRQEMLQVCYAMAETVFAVAQTRPEAAVSRLSVDARELESGKVIEVSRGRTILSCGSLVSGCQVEIRSVNGVKLEAGNVGRIVVSGSFLFSGYYRMKNEAVEQLLAAGWYDTRDLGFIQNGELYVLGRADDLIIVHGKNYYAHEIEAAANAVSGLKPGRNVAFGIDSPSVGSREAVLVAELDPSAVDLDRAALRRAIVRRVQEVVGVDLYDVSIVAPGWLVKTTSGKISRSANAQKYTTPKTADAAAQVAKTGDTLAQVADVIRGLFDAPDLVIDASTVAADVRGWDSLSHAVLLHTLEEKFRINIDADYAFDNVGVLADYIASRPRVTSHAAPKSAPSRQAANPIDQPAVTAELLSDGLPADLEQRARQGAKFRFKKGETSAALDCLLMLRNPASPRLFVSLHAAMDRSKVRLPLYARWNWGALFEANVLSISDPTLEYDPECRVGWYMGRYTDDVVGTMVTLAERIQGRLGIRPGNVVFYGSSAGGFASICAASRMKQGRAIAVNPQIWPAAYQAFLGGNTATRVAEIFAPGLGLHKVAKSFPLRWSALHAFERQRQLKLGSKIIIAQNRAGTHHYERQYSRFCEQIGAPIEGGVTPEGDVMSVLFNDPKNGHGAEPVELVRQLIDLSYSYLRAR